MPDRPQSSPAAHHDDLVAAPVVEQPGPRRPHLRLAITGLLLLFLTASPAIAAARPPRHQSSGNWAGYADTARAPFTAVSGRWVQPTATCDQPYPTYSAFWLGLGGFTSGSHALEQIGTEADCARAGHRHLHAWYELPPAAPVKLKLKVDPGDVLAARVSVHGDSVELRLSNITRHASYRKMISMSSPDTSSAEWIAEAPSECINPEQCQTLPLTDFGTVQFTHATATTSPGHPRNINDPAFTTTGVTLDAGGGASTLGPGPVLAGNGSPLAAPGNLSHHGRAFTITYQHHATPPPPPSAPAAQLRHEPSVIIHGTTEIRFTRGAKR